MLDGAPFPFVLKYAGFSRGEDTLDLCPAPGSGF